MITQKRKIGDSGEDSACRYLISNGYQIIHRNYTTKIGEIDIVAKKNKEIIFVEVKTGYSDGIVPEENITESKIKKLERLAQLHLSENKFPHSQKWQIDGIFVDIDRATGNTEIRHLENINIR